MRGSPAAAWSAICAPIEMPTSPIRQGSTSGRQRSHATAASTSGSLLQGLLERPSLRSWPRRSSSRTPYPCRASRRAWSTSPNRGEPAHERERAEDDDARPRDPFERPERAAALPDQLSADDRAEGEESGDHGERREGEEAGARHAPRVGATAATAH
jgi:hypothetical protein